MHSLINLICFWRISRFNLPNFFETFYLSTSLPEMASPDFEAMTVEDLGLWLEQQGIPREVIEKFEGVMLS